MHCWVMYGLMTRQSLSNLYQHVHALVDVAFGINWYQLNVHSVCAMRT